MAPDRSMPLTAESEADCEDRRAPRALSPEEVRACLREGKEARRQVRARIEKMERIDPTDASQRAR